MYAQNPFGDFDVVTVLCVASRVIKPDTTDGMCPKSISFISCVHQKTLGKERLFRKELVTCTFSAHSADFSLPVEPDLVVGGIHRCVPPSP